MMSPISTTTKHKRIVLGIDPGLGRMGYAAVTGSISLPKLLTVGCVQTSSNQEHGERLTAISKAVKTLLKKYKPTAVAIEKLYFSKNVKTALQVAEARGVIMLELAQSGCKIIELSPQAVKLAATGQGNADKLMVQKMLKLIFKLREVPTPDDAADALAVSLCGLTQ